MKECKALFSQPERAAAFVDAHGDQIARARLARLFAPTDPAPAAGLDALIAGEAPTGGWPLPGQQGIGSIDATCHRLWLAHTLGAAGDAAVQRGLRWLAGRQGADGTWREDPAVAAAAPAWAQTGPQQTLYLSANAAYILALLGDEAQLQAAQRGAAALAAQQDSEGRLPSYLVANWLAAGLWWRLGERNRCGRTLAYLTRRLSAELGDGEIAWMITSLRAAGVPGQHPLLVTAAALLAARQEASGSWAADGEDAAAVTVAVLDALRVQQRD